MLGFPSKVSLLGIQPRLVLATTRSIRNGSYWRVRSLADGFWKIEERRKERHQSISFKYVASPWIACGSRRPPHIITLYPFHGICFDTSTQQKPIIASPSGHQIKSPWISLHLSSTCFAILILQRLNHPLGKTLILTSGQITTTPKPELMVFGGWFPY